MRSTSINLTENNNKKLSIGHSMSKSSILGRVHSIDTYSTLDGFGIRSVVFLQGCDLRCIYCHNPDTWDTQKCTTYTSSKIISKLRKYSAYYGNSGGVTFSGGEPLLQVDFVDEFVTCIDRGFFKSRHCFSRIEFAVIDSVDITSFHFIK